jgi:SAM-dependent methyltransferase
MMCLLVVLRTKGSAPVADAAAHFDEIATDYGHQFSAHIWNHLLDRKVGMMAGALPPPAAAGRGLDLGCGLGIQCLALKARGYRVFGMDVARRLAAQARRAGIHVAAGSAVDLPFQDGSLDFAYAVGVLHHLPDRAMQQRACLEIGRVLTPGGTFLVHETNPRNPLFRFYMGYVFPVLKKIDEGTEWWIEPERWEATAGLRLVDVRYFTFMPDFIPAWLMRPFMALDRWLEASPLRRYSVHYMAVLERDPTWSPDLALQPAAHVGERVSPSQARGVPAPSGVMR